MLLKSNIKLMLKIKPNLENATELTFKFVHFVFIHHQFTLKSPSQLFFFLSHNAPSFASQDKINCKLHNNLLSPCLSTQPGRPWDILIFVHGGAPYFQYGTSTKELFKLSLLSLFCSLILLNSFQSVTEITNCKITINLERSFFFFAFVYIQILFSVSSWDGNQMTSENHIVPKLFCLIHPCIDTTRKKRILSFRKGLYVSLLMPFLKL